MTQDWHTIFTTDKLLDAKQVMATLSENEIAAVIINHKDTAFLYGEIEVHVKSEDAMKAGQLIHDLNFE